MPFLDIPHRIEYAGFGPLDGAAPVIVLLHQGLGSVSTWRDFPQRVHEVTALPVLVYSRRGYGASEPMPIIPGVLEHMHAAGRAELQQLLRGLGIRRPILFGHSDGACIAILYAAAGLAPAPAALALMAPHVFNEAITTEGARTALRAFRDGELRARLARHHADPDGAFHIWNDPWLAPATRDWSIERETAQLSCPLLLVQGLDDDYGTPEQLRRIEGLVRGPVQKVLLERCGHDPQRDQPEAVLAALRDWIGRTGPGHG